MKSKKPLKIDITHKCISIDKYYDSPGHAEMACCYEPVAMFRTKNGLASLPFLGIRFVRGKTYRIRVDEVCLKQ